MSSRGSVIRVGIGFALSAVLFAGCKDDTPAGAIMLAMSTDLEVPDDVNAVGLQVESNGQQIYSSVTQVVQEGSKRVVHLPATFAVRPPTDGTTAKMRARVVAYEGSGRALVLRQAATTVPTDRIALLRMPLLWANQIPGTPGAVTTASRRSLKLLANEQTPESVRDCSGPEVPVEATTTRINGVCAPSYFDSGSLPTCTTATCEDRLPGTNAGNIDDVALGGERCFSAIECFPNDRAALEQGDFHTVDRDAATKDCSATRCRIEKSALAIGGLPLDETTKLNFALRIPAGRGQCREGRSDCYIAIPHLASGSEMTGSGEAPLENWRYSEGAVLLPPVVASALAQGEYTLVRSVGCGTFIEGVELCKADTAGRFRFKHVDIPGEAFDAGVDGGDGDGGPVGNDGGVTKTGNLVMSATKPQMISTRGGAVYAMTNRGSVVRTTAPVGGCLPRDMSLPTATIVPESATPKPGYMFALSKHVLGGNIFTATAEIGAGAEGKTFITRGEMGATFEQTLEGAPKGIAANDQAVFFTSGGKLWYVEDADGTLQDKIEVALAPTADGIPTAIMWHDATQSLVFAGELPDRIKIHRYDCALRGLFCNTLTIGDLTFTDNVDHRVLAVTAFGDFIYIAETSTPAGMPPVRKIWFMDSQGRSGPVATIPDLVEPSVNAPPMQMPVDNNCIWIFRGTEADRELSCLRYRAPQIEKPITPFGRVGNAQGLAIDHESVYWGDRDEGSVRCALKPEPVTDSVTADEPTQLASNGSQLFIEEKGGGVLKHELHINVRTLLATTRVRTAPMGDTDHYLLGLGNGASGEMLALGSIKKDFVTTLYVGDPMNSGAISLAGGTGIKGLALVDFQPPSLIFGRAATGMDVSSDIVGATPGMAPTFTNFSSTQITAAAGDYSRFFYATGGAAVKPVVYARSFATTFDSKIDPALFQVGDIVESLTKVDYELAITVRRAGNAHVLLIDPNSIDGVNPPPVDDIGTFAIPTAVGAFPASQVAADDECVYVVENAGVTCLERESRVRRPIRAKDLVKPWAIYTTRDYRNPNIFVADPGARKVFAIERDYAEFANAALPQARTRRAR